MGQQPLPQSARPTRGRNAGRRDAAKTRARILRHATKAFAKNGYDGARVDDIARRVGVSVTLLYHYFGSKEGLFVAVMEEAFLLIRRHHRDIELAELPPRDAIAEIANSLFDLFHEHQELANLLGSENLHRARHVSRSRTIRGLYRPLMATLDEVIERGRAQGVFRRRVNGSDFAISLTGLAYFYFANRYTLSVVLDEDLQTPGRLERRRAHLVEMVLAYLATPESV